MEKKILIASNNQGKVLEIKSYLKQVGVEALSLEECKLENNITGPIPDPEENGKTYLENALIKARACSKWGGMPALADDSGLEVEYLNGEPGLFSARYAGENCSYADNVNKMLNAMKDADNRKASFLSLIALHLSDEEEYSFQGVLKGQITKEPIGTGGFGYDPIFMPDGCNQTLAELKPQQLDYPTHRIRALKKLCEFLKSIN